MMTQSGVHRYLHMSTLISCKSAEFEREFVYVQSSTMAKCLFEDNTVQLCVCVCDLSKQLVFECNK